MLLRNQSRRWNTINLKTIGGFVRSLCGSRKTPFTARLGTLVCYAFIAFANVGCDEELLRQYLADRNFDPNLAPLLIKASAVQRTLDWRTELDSVQAQKYEVYSQQMSPLLEDGCSQLIEGPPRGLACLHCKEPTAQGQAKVLTILMRRSCLRELAINYLVDGSFSYDEPFLLEQIEALTTNGRKLSLYLYLSNGPWQRRFENPPGAVFGSGISPLEFRERIVSDELLREDFRRIVKRVEPVIKYTLWKGSNVNLIPMLEDNLDDKAFAEMSSLIQATLDPTLPVSIGRNACPGCAEGNTFKVPSQFFPEFHLRSARPVPYGSLVTNDGHEYTSSTDSIQDPDGKPLVSMEELRILQAEAERYGASFILWSGRRQGLGLDFTNSMPSPAKRTYPIPTMEERVELIEFLQSGR